MINRIKVGDVVRLVSKSYDGMIHAYTKSGLNGINIPHGTNVTVLETWDDYVRIKFQTYTKRWVNIGNVESKVVGDQ